jgi:hypothetical protein
MLHGFFILLALTGPPQAAAANPAQAGSHVSLREPLRPLAFLVGSCWTGTFPGGTSTDTHCFEAVFGGMFVRDRHVVRGGKQPYEGETLYAWDPAKQKVTYTYWASDGAISTGTMEARGDTLRFSESYAGNTGGLTLQNVWTVTGSDAFDIVVSQRKDGAWREMWRMAMRRDRR